MHRRTVYYGQLAQETDILLSGRYAMTGLALSDQATFGAGPIVDGLAVTPTSPASLNVNVAPGSIYQQENLEQSAWSSLTADTSHTILKQGINLDPTTFGITPPTGTGNSQVFLVEAQYSDVDSGSVVLPYFNAALPSSPFSGPANAGTAQNTVRSGLVALQVKAGTAAATGSQIAPTADAGWVPLYYITVANGATSITSGNITLATGAPFIFTKLPFVPADSQSGKWVWAGTTAGTGSAYTATLSPVPGALTAGMEVRLKLHTNMLANPNLTVNGLGPAAILLRNGIAPSVNQFYAGDVLTLTYDGASWHMVTGQNPPQIFLTQNTVYYVNGPSGSDSNNGLTSGTAFATLQKAQSTIASLNLNGFNIDIYVADFTTGATYYAGPLVCNALAGVGTVTYHGNTTTPQVVQILNNTVGPAVIVTGGNYVFDGFAFRAPYHASGNGGHGFYGAGGGGTTVLKTIWLNDCVDAQIAADGTATVILQGPFTIVNSAFCFMWATNGGYIRSTLPTEPTLNFLNGLAETYFAYCVDGIIQVHFASISNFGNCGGQKYIAGGNGVINTSGSGVNYYPGTTAGSTTTGGQYF